MKSKYPTIVLSKDRLNRNVTNHQIHDIVFKIILEIDRVCRKNDIPYALAFGSLLGAVYYQDFIPWDDDADIVIDYFDLPRFIEALKKDLSPEFVFDCYEENKAYNVLIPTMKIRYKRSRVKEATNFWLPDRCNNGSGLFVDICVFMGVPESQKEHIKLINKSKRIMPLMCFMDALFHINMKKSKNKLKKLEKETANKYKDSSRVSQTVIIPFQQYPKKYVHEISFDRDTIYPFKEVEFRGQKLYTFNKPEQFAVERYGEFKEETHVKKGKHMRWVEIY